MVAVPSYILCCIENGLTVNVMVVSSISTGRNEFLILRCGEKKKLDVEFRLVNRQCVVNVMESGEQIISILGSLCLSSFNIYKKN